MYTVQTDTVVFFDLFILIHYASCPSLLHLQIIHNESLVKSLFCLCLTETLEIFHFYL